MQDAVVTACCKLSLRPKLSSILATDNGFIALQVAHPKLANGIPPMPSAALAIAPHVFWLFSTDWMG